MQANDVPSDIRANAPGNPLQIASWPHFVGLLLIGACVAIFGFLAQHGGSGSAPGGHLAVHAVAIRVYIVAIFMDWALFYYCWVGVHRRGGSLWSLSGGRWTSWRSVGIDLAIALPFWIVWEAVAYGVSRSLGPSAAKSVDSLLPQSVSEVLFWIATCITAGVCEEMVFRGYLQRQLHALAGNPAAAVVAQGLIFGLFHAYQGWKHVTVISVLGVLYGALAAWRRNLRVNIMTHAWSDIWEGWLKFLVWK